jgi:hypothetical protein
MLYVHNQFARDDQIPKWSDGSVVAFERQDKRENPTMTDGDGTTMLFMMNGNSAGRPVTRYNYIVSARRLPLAICHRPSRQWR